MPTILITGANRGIGLEFTKAYAKQGWQVIATVRNLSSAQKVDGNVQWVKLESESLTDAADVAKQLKEKDIKLDVVIANAAICTAPEEIMEVDPLAFDQHMVVNVRGVMVLFQAMQPLIVPNGKFIAISSTSGQINKESRPPGLGTYGVTKAALNYLVRQMHFETPELTVAGFNPGWVVTDMGTYCAKLQGLDDAPHDITQSIPGMMKLIEEGDRERLGGWMTNWSGERLDF